MCLTFLSKQMVFSTFLLSKDNDLAIENENINNYKAEHLLKYEFGTIC